MEEEKVEKRETQTRQKGMATRTGKHKSKVTQKWSRLNSGEKIQVYALKKTHHRINEGLVLAA